MRTADLIAHGVAVLKEAGVADCTTDVHLLLCHSLQLRRTELLLAAREEVDPAAMRHFLTLLARRQQREPLAYILGRQEFWSRDFIVNPAVLIPRPETEFLLESVVREVRSGGGLGDGMAVDLCCGSGVIAVVLALELKRAVTAIDISRQALALTGVNSRRHGVAERVHRVQSDLFAGFAWSQQAALVVSNPPYVSRQALHSEVEPEVRDHEPRLALDGGVRGLDIISRIRSELPHILQPGGLFCMEIGCDQGKAVLEMFAADGERSGDFGELRLLTDYAGRDRVLMARRQGT